MLGDNRGWEVHAEADQFRCVGVRISIGLWSETWSVILSEEDRLTVFEREQDTGLRA